MTSNSTDQLNLLTQTLKDLEEISGSELQHFTFTPKFIYGNLTKVTVTVQYDPMVEEK